ncbi:hypothetical protein GCM10027061_25240 [Nesterenkonia suensis]
MMFHAMSFPTTAFLTVRSSTAHTVARRATSHNDCSAWRDGSLTPGSAGPQACQNHGQHTIGELVVQRAGSQQPAVDDRAEEELRRQLRIHGLTGLTSLHPCRDARSGDVELRTEQTVNQFVSNDEVRLTLCSDRALEAVSGGLG